MNYPLFAGPTDDSGVFAQQCTLLLNLHTFKAACPLWYPLAPELTSNLLFNLPFWPRRHPHLTTHSELHYDLLSSFTSLKVLDCIAAFLCHPTPQCRTWNRAKAKPMSLKLSIKRKLRSFYWVPSLYGK